LKKDVFIFSSGELERKENTLCFTGKTFKKFVPVSAVSSIYLFSETSFNKRFLEFLSSNEIILHIFNYYGYYMGSFYPRSHHNSGYMTLKQCEHYLENSKRIELARKFVEGGLRNMIKNIMYYHNRGADLSSAIKLMENYINRLDEIEGIEELMALEGNAKEEYYSAFNKILKDENFLYEKRERRPPRSRLNALISFGNSLIYVTVLGEIYKTHLDPRVGFLHATNFRKFSLNLDVAEVFKPIISDRVIFALVNKKMLNDSCFAKELDGIYLSEKGRKIFVQKYEERLRQIVSFKKGKRCSYQRLIRLELYKIEKHLMGEQTYQPFISQW
jgi:CRISPR-associated protein Cas1